MLKLSDYVIILLKVVGVYSMNATYNMLFVYLKRSFYFFIVFYFFLSFSLYLFFFCEYVHMCMHIWVFFLCMSIPPSITQTSFLPFPLSLCFSLPHLLSLSLSLSLLFLFQYGWDTKPEDDHSAKLLRSTVIGLLDNFCSSDEGVLAEAKRRFNGHFDDPSLLPSDYKVCENILCETFLQLSSLFLFFFFWNISTIHYCRNMRDTFIMASISKFFFLNYPICSFLLTFFFLLNFLPYSTEHFSTIP